jgi:hypothetical protein
MTPANDLSVRRALELAGIDFLDENGGGPGVRLRNCHRPKQSKEALPSTVELLRTAGEQLAARPRSGRLGSNARRSQPTPCDSSFIAALPTI